MITFTEYVQPSTIWQGAEDFVDEGRKDYKLRGYNVEGIKDGKKDWLSAEWIYGNPEDNFNNEYHTWFYNMFGITLTGRIAFRGYGIEEYDADERETYIIPCM
ncbi:MAG: hypothetical protein UIM53_02985 [Acutalibacteraceae bacterium]|nr:hypothetical protein [Acutalibacteraceae bacterium]